MGNGTPATSRITGARLSVHSPSSLSRVSTPVSSPPPLDTAGWDSPETAWDAPAGKPPPTPAGPSMSGMTKAEKAAEMARRKEERKQVRAIPPFLTPS
jgi:SCY1-like protein 1